MWNSIASLRSWILLQDLPGNAWGAAFERYGLPLMMLVGIAWALRQLARWVAPRAEKVVDSHLAFVDYTRGVLDGITKEIGLQTTALTLVRERQTAVRESIEKHHAVLHNMTADLARAVKENTAATLAIVERLDRVLEQYERDRHPT